jgi:hypothetical protein
MRASSAAISYPPFRQLAGRGNPCQKIRTHLLIVIRLLPDDHLALFQDFVMRPDMLRDQIQRCLPVIGGPVIAVFRDGHNTPIGMPFHIASRGASAQIRDHSHGQQ